MTQQLLAPGIRGITRDDVEKMIARQNDPASTFRRIARLRREAWDLYEGMDLPDSGDEEWRRTDVRALDFGELRTSELTHTISGDADTAVISSMSAALENYEVGFERFDTAMFDLVRPDEWKFLALNAALWSDGLYVDVAPDTDVALPITMMTRGLTDGRAAFPRSLVRAGRGSRVRIVDDCGSDDVRKSLVSSAVEIVVEDGAHVEYYDINRWGDGVYNFKTVRATLGRDAEFTAMAAGIGSKLTKMRVDVEMPESGAQAKLLGVTFGDGHQHFDYSTLQNHTGKHTISDLQFKSALADYASLVWHGIVRINETAGGSEANQTSRNLLLSEHAKAAPIPILEIKAHDVSKCSHGATVGPVEETELFYLESRGIPHDLAEHMLVEGFFADVIDRIPNPEVRARVMDAVLAKAGGTAGALTFDEVMSAT